MSAYLHQKTYTRACTIVKNWKQPEFPPGRKNNKYTYVYTKNTCRHKNKNELLIPQQHDENHRQILSNRSQTDLYDIRFIYMSFKNRQN